MPEHAIPTETGAKAGSTEAAQLREELNRSREEVLRLRDLLISKDAELGSLKGQVAALEAGTARLLNLVKQVRSLLPGVVWRAATAVLRRLGRQG
ncbi:MAG TPA: hypothetical protein VFX85_01020 [Solirubrobacterales bacterium]|nr:hypothetical protein [Solirubrobacterales bacterium]